MHPFMTNLILNLSTVPSKWYVDIVYPSAINKTCSRWLKELPSLSIYESRDFFLYATFHPGCESALTTYIGTIIVERALVKAKKV